MLLPAIFPSLPSRLKERILTSAIRELSMSTMPSLPTPVCARQRLTHRDSGQVIAPSKFSMKI